MSIKLLGCQKTSENLHIHIHIPVYDDTITQINPVPAVTAPAPKAPRSNRPVNSRLPAKPTARPLNIPEPAPPPKPTRNKFFTSKTKNVSPVPVQTHVSEVCGSEDRDSVRSHVRNDVFGSVVQDPEPEEDQADEEAEEQEEESPKQKFEEQEVERELPKVIMWKSLETIFWSEVEKATLNILNQANCDRAEKIILSETLQVFLAV